MSARIVDPGHCDWFDDKMDHDFSVVSSIYYPAQKTAPLRGQLRAGGHTDYGSLTILAPTAAPGGLQVRTLAGDWVDVPYVPNNILMLALLVLVVYFATNSRVFLTFSNVKVLLTNYAAIGVVAATLALLVIAGQVDLSIGSNIGFSGMITALAMTFWQMSPFMGLVLGILSGAMIGLVNGILCAYLRFSPIIVTLGMLSVLRGATLLINPIEVNGLGDTFFLIGNGSLLGVPILLLVVFGFFLAAAGFLSLTVWWRYVFAIGVNPQAAFLAALPVRGVLLALFVATGAAAGASGVLLVSRLDGASPGSLGLQMELQALTIVLLGGVAFAGGRGKIFGVFTAWVFLGVLDNGLTLLNVPPFVQLVASGLALVFAASLDALGTFLGPRLEQRRRVAEQLSHIKDQPAQP